MLFLHPRQVVAFILFVMISPILLLLWVSIKLSDPTLPAFFTQTRIGKGGKPFPMWKMRTMRRIDTTETLVDRNDPRVTKLGRFLRRTHVDELIQIINVMLGNMAFIGPRPKLPWESIAAENEVRSWRRRYDYLPGMTGLRQIFGRGGNRFEATLDRLMFQKLHSWCFRIWIIKETGRRAVGFGGE